MSRRLKFTRESNPPSTVSSLLELKDEEVNAVEDPDEWEELEVMVDSGASHTVIGHDMVKAVESTNRKPGVSYQLADGSRVPHMGEKSFRAYTDAGLLRNVVAQVTDVHKP